MRPRRALLYMPANDWRKIHKATTLDVDSVCLDLEDGVALQCKPEARETLTRAFSSLDFHRAERLARINGVGSGLETGDLAAVLPARPDGIVIPKVAAAGQVEWVCDQITKAENAYGWPVGAIRVIALIESARGVLNLTEIAGADERLDALIFGAEDYAANVGAIRTPEGTEVLYARSAVVATAAAFELQAIDLLFLDFRDVEGLRREARRGAELGYTGMQIIHPNQIATVQDAFTPDDAAIAQAQQVIQVDREQQATGRGVFALAGRMVDRPIVRAAERTLARARAAGKLQ